MLYRADMERIVQGVNLVASWDFFICIGHLSSTCNTYWYLQPAYTMIVQYPAVSVKSMWVFVSHKGLSSLLGRSRVSTHLKVLTMRYVDTVGVRLVHLPFSREVSYHKPTWDFSYPIPSST